MVRAALPRDLGGRVLAVVTLLQGMSVVAASAQAWVPPEGVGSITISTQLIENTGHRTLDGVLQEDGKSRTVAVYVEGEYALTDRLSVVVGLPYVFARYLGPGPTLTGIILGSDLPVDRCRCWHGAWQDVGATVRFNLFNGPVALTPSVAISVPTHDYDFEGEAVVGFRLLEARLAVDAGVRLDALSPKVSLQGRYAYALVEKAAGISHNRSNISLRTEYAATRRLSAGGTVAWQRTHGGLRIGSITGAPFGPPGEADTIERFRQHDRLLRDNNWRLGANAALSFDGFDVFASYLRFMGGTQTHAGYAFTFGLSWPFGI